MVDFVKFLFSKKFILHATIALLITGGGLYAVFQYLDSYTLHGQTITVPDFSGKKLSELEEYAKEHDLGFKIIDSVYKVGEARGVVFEQNPKPESQVKKDRKIYLTVTRVLPPLVEVPNLKDVTNRIAFGVLESKGFRIGEVIYEPYIARDAVIRLEIKGKELREKAKVPKNTEIDVVLGLGQSDEKIPIPCLLGQDEEVAKLILRGQSLGFGVNVCEGCENAEDSASARVYRQSPDCDSTAAINLGGTIDIWRTTDSTKIPTIVISKDSTQTDSSQVK